uniref:Delta-InsB n=1 Tax=Citrobacter freundii TaxID=546 RepID=J7FQ55_CITFR|nr:delta-InsB [Citrobacter freundii]
MAENRVEANAHNAGGCPASNAIHGHINDFLVRTGLRSGVSELQLPCFTAVRAEIALVSGRDIFPGNYFTQNNKASGMPCRWLSRTLVMKNRNQSGEVRWAIFRLESDI